MAAVARGEGRIPDLGNLSLADMTVLSAELRGLKGRTLSEVAEQAVRHLYDTFTDESTGERACALVRIYSTSRLADLEPGVQSVATSILGDAASSDVRCFTLRATAGIEQAWNSTSNSAGHRTIPLPSEEAVAEIPMLAALIRQLGFELSSVVRGDVGVVVDEAERTYNVFHVPEAAGSPFIPAQADFVIPYGIRSVVGFGGLLPDGELFASILFSRSFISRDIAELFGPVALSLKLAFLSANGRKT